MDMAGKNVIVAGGAGHIGSAAVETFAELGARVAVMDLDPDRCQQVADTVMREYGGEAVAVACDLEHFETIPEAIDRMGSQWATLDVLVNCAAFVGTSNLPGWAVAFEEQSVKTWERSLTVNLTAPFALVQATASRLRQSRGVASVILLSSIYGEVGPDMSLYDGLEIGNPAAYSAAKGGVNQLSRWLATVLAPKVRVNVICPGGVAREQPEAFQARYRDRTPLRRLAIEEDMKGAFAFLGSDLSAYVTGATVRIDGGWTSW